MKELTHTQLAGSQSYLSSWPLSTRGRVKGKPFPIYFTYPFPRLVQLRSLVSYALLGEEIKGPSYLPEPNLNPVSYNLHKFRLSEGQLRSIYSAVILSL